MVDDGSFITESTNIKIKSCVGVKSILDYGLVGSHLFHSPFSLVQRYAFILIMIFITVIVDVSI